MSRQSTLSDDRYAERRAQYLRREHGLTDTEAKTVAYHELGYSDSGAAGRMGLTKGTVKAARKRLEEEFGEGAAMAKNEAGQLTLEESLYPHL